MMGMNDNTTKPTEAAVAIANALSDKWAIGESSRYGENMPDWFGASVEEIAEVIDNCPEFAQHWPRPIPVSERLPDDGQHVLVYIDNDRHQRDRPSYWAEAKFCRGKVVKGEVGDVICSADQWGNNHAPYCWQGPGPMSWRGQMGTHWLELPPKPE